METRNPSTVVQILAILRAATGGLALVVVSCGEDTSHRPARETSGPPLVLTTFYPTLYFVERIAGDRVRAVCPVPDHEDPIFWKPGAGAIEQYQRADLVIINGAGFEKWIEKVSLRSSRVVDTAHDLTASFIRHEGRVTHSHGPAGDHAHEGLDGHTWVDPVNALEQARAIRDALCRRFPAHRDTFAEGFTALEVDLRSLDEAFRQLTGAGARPPILCSHPAYNYIARRYGWNIRNLDLDPLTMPPEEVLAAIKEQLEEFPAKFLLWESAPSSAIADLFRTELGLESVVFSPCELLDDAESARQQDYMAIMRENIAAITPVFSGNEGR